MTTQQNKPAPITPLEFELLDALKATLRDPYSGPEINGSVWRIYCDRRSQDGHAPDCGLVRAQNLLAKHRDEA